MSWQKQTTKPLFPKVIWAMPQRQDQTARILVIGGNRESIKAPLAIHAALGPVFKQVSIVLPDIFQKQFKGGDGLIFCPSNQSGSLASRSLKILQQACSRHDCLLLAGDLTHNSQTTLLIDELLRSTELPTIASGDIADWLLPQVDHHQKRLVLIAPPSRLQSCLSGSQASQTYKPDLSLHLFAQLLMSLPASLQLVSWHGHHLWVRVGQDVISSPISDEQLADQQLAQLISKVSLYLNQDAIQPLAALASAIYPEA